MKRRSLVLLLVVIVIAGLTLPFGAQPRAVKVGVARAQDGDSLLIWADATRSVPLTALAEQFTEEFGVEVTVQEVGSGDIRNNLPIDGPAGTGPDIIVAAHDWIGELVVNGAVIPLNLGEKAELFSPESLRLFSYNGEIYGMPYAVENVAFFRNTDLVPEAPATWDEVRATTEELVSSGASTYGYIIQESDPYHLFPLMSAFGGYVFGLDENGNYNAEDVGIDNEGSIAAMDWLAGMVADGYVVPSVDYDVMHELFETGEAAMMMTGPWALARIRESGVPYAISNIPAGPAGPGKPFIGGGGFMISAWSANSLLAEIFLLDFMANVEPMQALYDADPRPPAFLPLREQLSDPDLLAFQEAGAVGEPMPSIPEMASVWGAWGGAQGFVIRAEQAPDQAMSDAAVVIRDLIAGRTPAPTGETVSETGEIVGIPGTIQTALGCPGDWAPECENTLMVLGADGVWRATFDLPAGNYEYKVALNGTWEENYGAGAVQDGPNIALSLSEDATVTFVYDPVSHWIADSVNSLIASAPGSYQSEIGCTGDWAPDCLLSWLQDTDGDGVYTFTTTAIPAGDYEVKVALNQSWELNYGADAAQDGPNIPFSVAADGTEVTFSFDSATNLLTVNVAG